MHTVSYRKTKREMCPYTHTYIYICIHVSKQVILVFVCKQGINRSPAVARVAHFVLDHVGYNCLPVKHLSKSGWIQRDLCYTCDDCNPDAGSKDIYVHLYLYRYLYIFLYMSTYMICFQHVYIYIYIYVCLCIICISVCVQVHMHIYVHTPMYIHLYMYMYINICTCACV